MDFRFFNNDNKENVDQNAKELKRRPMPSFLTHNQDNTHTYKVAGDTIQFFCSQTVILALILCNKMAQQQFIRHQAFLFSALTFPEQFKMYVVVVLILLFSLTKQQIQLLHFRQ